MLMTQAAPRTRVREMVVDARCEGSGTLAKWWELDAARCPECGCGMLVPTGHFPEHRRLKLVRKVEVLR